MTTMTTAAIERWFSSPAISAFVDYRTDNGLQANRRQDRVSDAPFRADCDSARISQASESFEITNQAPGAGQIPVKVQIPM
jgi:hypothetical protein